MKFLSTQQLMALPAPTWLIRGILPSEGLNLLYGPPNEGKSFVALSMALAVSTGHDWEGRRVQQGHVAYIAAEGGRGMKKRASAWMQHHGLDDLPNISWYLDALDIESDSLVDDFIICLAARFPVDFGLNLKLIIIDTLSRNFGGADENSSEAMPRFINKVEAFSKVHGAAVLIVHHTNAEGRRERGHTALRGALESAFKCTATKDEDGRLEIITLTNDKQKEDVGAGDLFFKPRVVTLSSLPPDEDGKALTSLVLQATKRPQKEGQGGYSASLAVG